MIYSARSFCRFREGSLHCCTSMGKPTGRSQRLRSGSVLPASTHAHTSAHHHENSSHLTAGFSIQYHVWLHHWCSPWTALFIVSWYGESWLPTPFSFPSAKYRGPMADGVTTPSGLPQGPAYACDLTEPWWFVELFECGITPQTKAHMPHRQTDGHPRSTVSLALPTHKVKALSFISAHACQKNRFPLIPPATECNQCVTQLVSTISSPNLSQVYNSQGC